ncbi:MAG: Ig-like domain-containing protein, partial [Lachnospiraceae bacterium]|nr:Ig-like domain-containing protein [Lachnospiraceae bacterium]
WVSSDTSVAMVTNAGVVTAKGAGKATITCFTVQKTSGTYSKIEKATAKKSIEIEVNDPAVIGITKVTQLTKTDIAVDFADDFSKNISIDNLIISKNGITMPVKDKIKFENGGKRAILSAYQDYVDGAQYIVRYNNPLITEGKEATFNATIGEVERIELYTELGSDMVIAGKQSYIKFKMFNGSNVDITPTDVNSSEYMAAMSRLYLKFADDSSVNLGYVDNSTKSVYIYEKGKSVRLMAEYVYYPVTSGSSYTEKKVPATLQVTSVTEASTMTFDRAVVTKVNKDVSKINWDQPTSRLSISDKEGYKLVARIKKLDGTYVYSSDINSHIIFGSNVSKTCYVTPDGGLVPLAQGSEDIVVYYGDSISSGTPIGQLKVTVVEKRIPANIVFGTGDTQVNVLKMSDAFNVSRESLAFRVLDQYGEQLDIVGVGSSSYVTTVTASCLENNGPYATVTANSDGTGIVEVDALGRGTSSGSTYRIKVSYNDPQYGSYDGYFTVLVFTPNSNASSTYSVSVEGDTNMTITPTSLPELSISLFEVKNSIKYQKIEHVKVAPDISGFTLYEGECYYRIYKTENGKEIKKGLENDIIKPVYSDSGNGLVKYETGEYIIKVFRRQSNGITYIDPQIAMGAFKLTDTTGTVSWKRVSTTTNIPIKEGMTEEMLKPILGECIQFSIGTASVGTSQISFPDAPYVFEGQVFFRTVAITQAINVGTTTYSLKHTITLNEVIRNK